MLTLNNLKNWVFQKDFKLYLYSVLTMVFAIFFLLLFVGVTNPDYFNIFKQYFILNTTNLNTNIFLSSYTHTNPDHLIQNIITYIILFLLVFSLVDNKKKIKQLMFLGLIIFPFVNSLLLALFTDINAGAGLSGINACMNGYLFFAISYNLSKNSIIPLKKYTILMLIVFNLLAASYFMFKNFYLIIFAIIIIFFLFYTNRSIVFKACKALTNLTNSTNADVEKCLMIIMWAAALVFAIFAFRMLAPVIPSELEIGYNVHYLGWSYGLIFSWLILGKFR